MTSPPPLVGGGDDAATAAANAPFVSSRTSRLSYLERTRTLLSAVTASSANRRQTLSLQSPSPSSSPTDSDSERKITTCTVLLRSLTSLEITTLEGPDCRCRCDGDDWSNVKAMSMGPVRGEGVAAGCDDNEYDDDASAWFRRNVSDTSFGGWVVLGVPSSSSAEEARRTSLKANKQKFGPPGVRSNLLVRNSILEYGAVVSGNGTVSDVHVCAEAAVFNCGSVSFEGCCGEEEEDVDGSSNKFKDGMVITVGAESGGGRSVNVTVESTLIDVCGALGMGTMAAVKRASNASAEEAVTAAMTAMSTTTATAAIIPMNILCPHSYLAHTPNIHGVYLSPHSRIDAATSIARAILLPHSSISSSVTATSVYLQWHASITTNTSISHTLLMEHAAVGPNSLISHSLLGPDVHVSAGEVHATLLGPNTNAHHQSLLIGVLWPLGRGNVGYGANVGSNHTARLPDQECVSGEGTFWGLTCCVKMPLDVSGSPYSVIAAGSSLTPGQRLSMPFSLIIDSPTGGEEQGGGSGTDIMPGWVLYASPYTVSRSEVKFATRRKAQRHGYYSGWKIIRPGVIDLCVAARRSLVAAAAAAGVAAAAGGNASSSSAKGQATGEAPSAPTDALSGGGSNNKKAVYHTDRDVPGIGSCRLTERSRLGGITAYTDIIRLYALRGLADKARGAWGLCGGDGGDGDGDGGSGGDAKAVEFERALADAVGDTTQWRNGGGGGALAMVQSEASSSAVETTTKKKVKAKATVDWPPLPWEEPSFANPHVLWDHQRSILAAETPSMLSGKSSSSPPSTLTSSPATRLVLSLLRHYVTLETHYANRVRKSKLRDDVRGAATVPGYADSHVEADHDGVVREVLQVAKEAAEMVDAMEDMVLGGGRRGEGNNGIASRL